MTTARDSILEEAYAIHKSLEELLDGMDYCLDWKAEDTDWSAREVLFHILEVPEGGIGAAIGEVIDGELLQLTIIDGETNLTPEREALDLEAIIELIQAYFTRLEEVLANTTDQQLEQLTTQCYLPSLNRYEDRTPRKLLEELLVRHWTEHLGQLSDLRSNLGLS